MRQMEFKMERQGLLEEGQEVNVTESALPTSYYYTITPAVAMSRNYQAYERLQSRKGIVKEVKETPRGFYTVVEFDEDEHPVVHPIPPVYRADSRILILGSVPSVKSRETGFFYGHPQNRFWKVTAAVCGEEVPQTVEEKKAFLLRNHIAVWDVIASCVITGSSDASIRDVVPNTLQDILECADIRQIYCNGATAWKYYRKYQEKQLGREAVRLPSTSPANAAWSVERLLGEWSQCGEVLRNGE